MNLQIILVLIIFAAAVVYLVRMLINNLKPEKGCGGNCKCGVDFSAVDKN